MNKNNNENELYLIVEDSKSKLNVVQNSENDYILEGVFAEFGVENNNERIYEESEYLPHLEYLTEKIKDGRLFGEIDHPERYETKLEKISHVVEKLEYNKESRTLVGRVKLLGTPQGEIAKSLINSNIQLSISSRAAGTVTENKKVKIQQIFAYDLVAEPGFQKASLTRVNESLGINSKNLAIFKMDENFKNKGNNMNVEELEKQINEFKQNVNEINSEISESNIGDIPHIKKWINNTSDSINNNFNKYDTTQQNLVNYSETMFENVIKHNDYVVESTNGLADEVGKISKTVDKLSKFADYLAEKLDMSINHGDYLVDKMVQGSAYSNYLAEKIEESINHSDYIAEKVDENIAYGKYVAEIVDQSINHGNYLAETLDKSISFSEYSAEKIDQAIKFTETVSEDRGNKRVIETKNDASMFDEEVSVKVDSIIKNAQNKEKRKMNEKHNFNYVSLLSNTDKNLFKTEKMKTQNDVLVECKKLGITTPQQFKNIWKNVNEGYKYSTDYIVSKMPKDLKNVWRRLDEAKKQDIVNQSKIYDLSTDERISEFWYTRTGLNESARVAKDSRELRRGTSNLNEDMKVSTIQNNYIKLIGQRVQRLNK